MRVRNFTLLRLSYEFVLCSSAIFFFPLLSSYVKMLEVHNSEGSILLLKSKDVNFLVTKLL